jgi:hypothetical protein
MLPGYGDPQTWGASTPHEEGPDWDQVAKDLIQQLTVEDAIALIASSDRQIASQTKNAIVEAMADALSKSTERYCQCITQ